LHRFKEQADLTCMKKIHIGGDIAGAKVYVFGFFGYKPSKVLKWSL
jgi:hypothetical protein